MPSHDTIVYLASHPAIVGGRIEDAAAVVTETIGRAAQVARASVWLLENDATQLRCVDLYEKNRHCHLGVSPLSARDYPLYFAALQAHRAIPVEDARHDHRTTELASRYLRAHDIGAMLDAGIREGGAIVGVLCLEHVGGPRVWSGEDVALAGAAADQIAFTLANAKLRRSLKDEFLLALSHELRTPMTSILGWATLLSSGEVKPETMARGLGAIIKNAEAELHQIEEVLELATIFTGRLALTRAPVELRAVVSDVVAAARPMAVARTVSLEAALPDEELWLAGEADRLREIVHQLIDNAVKFSRAEGHVAVTLSADRQTITLVVHDDGIGVGAAFLPEVFEAFQQEDTGLARNYGGLGIGLTVARALAEAHGGTLTAASPGRGGGATFTLTLPRTASPR